MRRRLPTLGLRGRIVAALVLTSAVVLGVAALRLLPQLQHQLRREEVTSLRDTAVASRPSFEDLEGDELGPRSLRLHRMTEALERRTGARVLIFDGRGRLLQDTQPRKPGHFGDVPVVLSKHRPVSGVRLGQTTQADEARLALPMTIAHRPYVLVLRKPLDDATAAAHAVRRAFTVASLAGLGVALLLGIGIAATLVRRLRRLRDATLVLADHGLDSELATDSARDEVGDLGRAFATMQERLREQEKARRKFVSTASHELRTPLTSLRMMLELLEEDLHADPPDVDDAREQATLARAQSVRLAGLASDLLDLSRLDADVPLRREAVDLADIRRAAIAEFDAATVGQARVEAPGEGVDCWALADPTAVVRIVRILVDNALRFSPPDRPVRVELGAAGGSAVVTVTDHGPGVPETERERIFSRFERGTAAGGQGGFGLGLAIGRELAERMGGSLALEPSDEGARFALRLPAAEPLHALTETQPQEVPG
ncbi:MAG TPA: HAMP domain-containing sensor histidine kinase [Thermoleophilaceae bacterium]|nr:HAMP domain-containing sensor histidine kinase [Thermoleophilaceae bacterium]